jgi:hypothetical protein
MLVTARKEILAAYFKVHLGETETNHVNSIRIAGFGDKTILSLVSATKFQITYYETFKGC